MHPTQANTMAEEAEGLKDLNLDEVEEGQGGATKKPLAWIVLLIAGGLLAAVAGFFAGRIFGSAGPATAQAEEEAFEEPLPDNGDFRYSAFEPITVTLKTPRGDRYLRAALVLKIHANHMESASELIERQKPDIKDWLIVYLSNHSLDEVLGGKNQNRIRREILDSLNQMLWPKRKPRIHQVLMKEFAVQ
jgi:flagellar basal body-associated protein FliL